MVVVTLAGRLGEAAARPLFDVLRDAVSQAKRKLLIDLSGVDYVSSPGIDTINKVAGLARDGNVDIVLTGVSEPVRFTLELGGVLARFAVEPTRHLALLRLEG